MHKERNSVYIYFLAQFFFINYQQKVKARKKEIGTEPAAAIEPVAPTTHFFGRSWGFHYK